MKIVSKAIGSWLSARNLLLLHRIHGASVGDVLTATAFMRSVHEQTGKCFVVVSKYPEIFDNNPIVKHNIGMAKLGMLSKPLVKGVLRHIQHAAVGEYGYQPPAHFSEEDISNDHRRPISETEFCSEALSKKWGLQIPYSELSPEIHFSSVELAELKRKFSLPREYCVVRPAGPVSYTPNREWGFHHFQEVVHRSPWITWVQAGVPKDRRLEGVIDFCEKSSLRDLFYIIRRSRGVLASEGLPNHVAAAFKIPSFVVFSGFNHPELSMYSRTIPIIRAPQVECAPCWKLSPCPVPGKPCTEDISVDQVLATLERQLPNQSFMHSPAPLD